MLERAPIGFDDWLQQSISNRAQEDARPLRLIRSREAPRNLRALPGYHNAALDTDITDVRPWQGWLYLAVVMDLFSRMIGGGAAGPTIHRAPVLTAVLMAVRRRRPRRMLIHSDQARSPAVTPGGESVARIASSHA